MQAKLNEGKVRRNAENPPSEAPSSPARLRVTPVFEFSRRVIRWFSRGRWVISFAVYAYRNYGH
jgi:hypothetical protein